MIFEILEGNELKEIITNDEIIPPTPIRGNYFTIDCVCGVLAFLTIGFFVVMLAYTCHNQIGMCGMN
jgi:hypothetical protein